MRLARSFFERPTPRVAKELVGCKLVRVIDGERLSGFIVETEAYRGTRDPASHAHRGKTPRNEVMFGEAGHAYVYFIYGFHNCLNITTEPAGMPGAVLVRAIEPLEGASAMEKNRERGGLVANGPGKLAKAMKIDRSLNGEDLVASERLFLESGRKEPKVTSGTRVGITKGLGYRWRFYVQGSPFVSGARRGLRRGTHN